MFDAGNSIGWYWERKKRRAGEIIDV